MNEKQLAGFQRDWNCDKHTAARYYTLTADGVYPWKALIITGLTEQRS